MNGFLAATAVTPAGDGRFEIDLHPAWTVGVKMHGGYLMAVLARAAASVAGAGHPHLTAIGASFISAPEPGPADVHVELLRQGRSATQLRAQLHQGSELCVEAVLTQGLLTSDNPWWTGLEPVSVPPMEECVRLPSDSPVGVHVALNDIIETYADPATLGWAVGKPAGRGVISGWQRHADGSDWDPASLVVALDAPPPVSFDLGAPGWAPTIQFSAYLRRLPAPGPLTFRMHANDLGGERMDETCFAWDSKGRLVGQSTQIAGVRTPPVG